MRDSLKYLSKLFLLKIKSILSFKYFLNNPFTKNLFMLPAKRQLFNNETRGIFYA